MSLTMAFPAIAMKSLRVGKFNASAFYRIIGAAPSWLPRRGVATSPKQLMSGGLSPLSNSCCNTYSRCPPPPGDKGFW